MLYSNPINPPIPATVHRLSTFYRRGPVLKAEVTVCSLARPIFTQSEHSCYFRLKPIAILILTLINPHKLWKNYTLIQFCGVRTGPRDYFELCVILHHYAKGLLTITFHSNKVTIFVTAGSARTPHNWMRVKCASFLSFCSRLLILTSRYYLLVQNYFTL